jgi:single-strand DNA-binding protein
MASRSVNKVILLGHLGRDAEIKYTPNGTARCTFTLATSRRWKDQQSGEWKEETDWHNIVMWRAENVATHLQKGKQVYVEGRLQTRSWEDKDGNKRYTTEVVSENLILLGGRGGESFSTGTSEDEAAPAPVSAGRGGPARAAVTPAAQHDTSQEISDDDVPF